MARVTVEDCLKQIPDRFLIVHLAVERVKQLRKGAQPLVKSSNKEIITALREIAAGKVTFENLEELAKEAEEKRIMEALRLEIDKNSK